MTTSGVSMANLKCPECGYDNGRNMSTHLFFKHGYSKQKITEWKAEAKTDMLMARAHSDFSVFRCRYCPRAYRRSNSCRAHERKVHSVPTVHRPKSVPCPLQNCEFVTTSLLDLCAHAKEKHSSLGKYVIREERFESINEFNEWRQKVESERGTAYTTESVNGNAANGTTLKYFKCAQLETWLRRYRQSIRMQREEGRKRIRMRMKEKKRREFSKSASSGVDGGTKGATTSTEKKTIMKMTSAKDEDEDVDVEEVDDGNSSSSESDIDHHSRRRNRRSGRGEGGGVSPGTSVPPIDDDDDDDMYLYPLMDEDEEEWRQAERRHCTAHMRVLILRNGCVHVEYCDAHLGHDYIESGTQNRHPSPDPSPAPSPPPTLPRLSRLTPSEAATTSSTRRKRRLERSPDELMVEESIIDHDIECAKRRRKGRMEQESRRLREQRIRQEQYEFEELLCTYDDIGANVELSEQKGPTRVYDSMEREIVEEVVVEGYEGEELLVVEDEDDVVIREVEAEPDPEPESSHPEREPVCSNVLSTI